MKESWCACGCMCLLKTGCGEGVPQCSDGPLAAMCRLRSTCFRQKSFTGRRSWVGTLRLPLLMDHQLCKMLIRHSNQRKVNIPSNIKHIRVNLIDQQWCCQVCRSASLEREMHLHVTVCGTEFFPWRSTLSIPLLPCFSRLRPTKAGWVQPKRRFVCCNIQRHCWDKRLVGIKHLMSSCHGLCADCGGSGGDGVTVHDS